MVMPEPDSVLESQFHTETARRAVLAMGSWQEGYLLLHDDQCGSWRNLGAKAQWAAVN